MGFGLIIFRVQGELLFFRVQGELFFSGFRVRVHSAQMDQVCEATNPELSTLSWGCTRGCGPKFRDFEGLGA